MFLLSAGGALLMKSFPAGEEKAEQVFTGADRMELLCSPTGSWQETAAFGAQFSDAYGQWSFRDSIDFRLKAGGAVYAPMSGTIQRVEALEQGGSRVTMQCENEVEIALEPVHSLRIFIGSRVVQGDVLGSGGEALSMRAWKGGRAIDPLILTEY